MSNGSELPPITATQVHPRYVEFLCPTPYASSHQQKKAVSLWVLAETYKQRNFCAICGSELALVTKLTEGQRLYLRALALDGA